MEEKYVIVQAVKGRLVVYLTDCVPCNTAVTVCMNQTSEKSTDSLRVLEKKNENFQY